MSERNDIVSAEITVTFENGEKKTLKTTNFFFVSAEKKGTGANISRLSAVNIDPVLSAVIHMHTRRIVEELEERDPFLKNETFQALLEQALKDMGVTV